MKFFSLSNSFTRDLVFALPSVIVLVALTTLVTMALANTEAIEDRYRVSARQAMKNGEYEQARVFFGRVLRGDPRAQPNDWFSYAQVLESVGESKQSRSILDQLAPDDRSGFPDAHEYIATRMADGLAESQDETDLAKLHHHLTHSRNSHGGIALMRAWSLYYMATAQPVKAGEMIDAMVEENLAVLPLAVRMHAKLGNEGKKRKYARRSIEYLTQKLTGDPFDVPVRIELATMLTAVDEEEVAERVLLEGAALQKEPVIRKALSEFFIHRFRKTASRGYSDFSEQLGLLGKVLALDPLNQTAYQLLVGLYQQHSSETERSAVKKKLQEIIASGKGVALAHFALSDLCAIEGQYDEMQWHAEKAYELQPGLTVVANNLAWLLAHNDPPDLDRAVHLATKVVESSPSRPEFLDTLGTVQMKRGDYDDAIVSLERALSGFENKHSIHKKLAILYRKVGRSKLAVMHEERAGTTLDN